MGCPGSMMDLRAHETDRALPLAGAHLPHGLEVDLEPTFAQRRRNGLGNLLR
jgi:hypothetical protein